MPQIRSGSVVTAATALPGYTITVPRPAGLANGDLIVVSLGAQTDSVASTTWAWAVSGTTPAFVDDVATGRSSSWNINGKVLRRYVTDAATEPAEYSFATGANTTSNISAVACAVTGADPTTPIDVLGSHATETSLRLYGPGITTVSNGCLLMMGATSERNVSHYSPAEMTELAQVSSTGGSATNTINTVSLHVESALQAAAGATGDRIGSIGGTSNRDTYSTLLAIRPADASSTVNPKIGELTETYDDEINWNLTAIGSFINGEHQIPAPATNAYGSSTSADLFDLTESACHVQVLETLAGTSAETIFTIVNEAGDKIQMIKAGTSIIVRQTVAGSNTSHSTTAYDPATMRVWGFKESSGTVVARYSADGVNWTNFGTGFNAPFNLEAIRAATEAGYWDSLDNGLITGTARFDNFNLLPDSGSAPAEPANAGTDQIVQSGSTVTLVGTPPGGVWAQESGDAVTLSAPVTDDLDTRVTFMAGNESTSSSLERVFRYTTVSVDTVKIAPAAVQNTASTSSLSTTFATAPVARNLIIASLSVDKDTGVAITPPAGFTLVQEYRAASVSGALAYRIADGTETTIGSWTWTGGSSRMNVASAQEYNILDAALASSYLSPDNENAVSTVSGSITGGTFVVGQVGVDTANAPWSADTDPVLKGLIKVLRAGATATTYVGGQPGMAVGVADKISSETLSVTSTSSGSDQQYMILAAFNGVM